MTRNLMLSSTPRSYFEFAKLNNIEQKTHYTRSFMENESIHQLMFAAKLLGGCIPAVLDPYRLSQVVFRKIYFLNSLDQDFVWFMDKMKKS